RTAELFNERDVPGLREPLVHAARNNITDFVQFLELIDLSLVNFVEGGKLTGQGFGDASADMENAKTVDEAPQLARLAGLDGIKKVLCGLLAHTLQAGDLV